MTSYSKRSIFVRHLLTRRSVIRSSLRSLGTSYRCFSPLIFISKNKYGFNKFRVNFESKFIDKTGYYYRTQSRELLKKLDVIIFKISSYCLDSRIPRSSVLDNRIWGFADRPILWQPEFIASDIIIGAGIY